MKIFTLVDSYPRETFQAQKVPRCPCIAPYPQMHLDLQVCNSTNWITDLLHKLFVDNDVAVGLIRPESLYNGWPDVALTIVSMKEQYFLILLYSILICISSSLGYLVFYSLVVFNLWN